MTLVGPAGGVTGSLKQRASQVAGAVGVAIASAALVGWSAGLPQLSSWGPDLPTMRPAGALCLAALGLALIKPGRNQRIAAAVGAVVALLASFLLVAALFKVNGDIQQFALRSPMPVSDPGSPPFRIVHISTLAFCLIGAAFALSRQERLRLLVTGLAGLTGAILVFALLSYLSGIDTLYRTASIATPPLPTAVGLLCVATGFLLRIGAMPALRTPQPLWRLLSVLGCAIIVPLLLFGAYAEVSIADAHLHEMRRGLLLEARALSSEIDREILGEIERLQALAASPSLRQGDFAAFQRQAEASLALRHSGDIILVDRDMRELVDTGTPYGLSMERAEVPDSVARALATGKPQFTDLFTVSKTNQVMFGIIVPVVIDGANRYGLMRSLSQHALAEPIASDRLPPGWQAVIAGASHRVLARSGQDLPLGAALPEPQRHGAAKSGIFEFTDTKGQAALEAYADSALTGWETAVWEPKALLEAPVRALWRTLGWLALMSLGLVVGLALWLGRVISISVGDIANHAMGFVGGGVAPARTPVAEVNALTAQLREAAARRQAAEDLLRASERQLRLVTDNVPVAIIRCDADARCMFANKLFLERRGLTSDDVVGRHLSEVVGDRDFSSVERYVAECLAGNPVQFEFDTADRAGNHLCLQGRFAPEWRDEEVVGLIGATTNITTLKQAERRLRASEITFRRLVDDSPFGIYVMDTDFRLVQASLGARASFAGVQPLIGGDLAHVLRTTWEEPFASEAINRFHHTLATGEPHHAPSSIQRRKDTGAVEFHDWKIERLIMPDGRPGVVCHFYDLSERQKYEAALRESEAIFRAMFDSSAVGKVEVDVETGRFLRANAAMCRFVGYSEEELRRLTLLEITHPDERDRDHQALLCMAHGTTPVFDRENRFIRKDGAVIWTRITANTIRDVSGRAVRAIAVVQDLNERKRAEQELEASRTRLQLALDAARLGWFQYDPVRRSGWGDARFREIYDLSTPETPLNVLVERVHPDDVERMQANLAASLDPVNPQPALLEYRVVRRDGEIRWVEVHGLATFEGEGSERRAVSLIGAVQDITERKRHEEQTHLLMREVNHRAKNMLSVVDAIAHQTATKSPDDFIARFSERIQALSANQDLLVRNEWNGVVIAELVRAQLAHFSDLIGSRIMVRGPGLRLKAASAQAIGLALHELATNAGKYGALSTETGCVNIRWQIEDDTFQMSWTECNGPPVRPPKRRGFGTIVMEMMAERTVGGKVDLDYAPSGIQWHLSCPAANALERSDREIAERVPA